VKRPRVEQPALFDRDGHITPAARPDQAPRRTPRARQDALFPIPEGAKLTRAQARQRLERLQPGRAAWHPQPAPGRSPYRQPALFNQQGRLHPDVKNAATPRPKTVPATPPAAPTPSARTRTSTARPSPPDGTAGAGNRARKALPPPVSGAPSAVGRAPRPAPEVAPRLVPVRMAAAPTPRKPRRTRRAQNGGE
jgi:hypothetical protein